MPNIRVAACIQASAIPGDGSKKNTPIVRGIVESVSVGVTEDERQAKRGSLGQSSLQAIVIRDIGVGKERDVTNIREFLLVWLRRDLGGSIRVTVRVEGLQTDGSRGQPRVLS